MRFHVTSVCRFLLFSASLVVIPVTIKQLIMLQSVYSDEGSGQDVEDNDASDMSFGNNSGNHDTVPFHPFKPGQPKFVVILTYQRCGSSAVGQFFNSNPELFYYFEPLDSLYSSLYGTKQGWNIPSDITSYADGTERKIPPKESKEVSHFLRNLLSCDIDSLPTETLVHRFLFTLSSDFSASASYIECLRRKNIDYTRCENMTETFCGTRFGEMSEAILATCNRLLQKASANQRDNVPRRTSRRFVTYRLCMNQLRLEVDDSCAPLLQNACSSSDVRVTKLVRGSMESMEPLLKTIPNFRVIHLIRDPRAVTLSRKEFDSSGRGLYAKHASDSMTKEAAVYCRDAIRDTKIRRRLEKLYPGKIYTVVHDEIFSNTARTVRNLYRFVDEQVHKDTWNWLDTKRYLTRSLYRWQDQLTFQESREIYLVCRELFELIKSDKWTM